MKIEVFYIAGCPNHVPAIQRIQDALGATGMSAAIQEIEVRDAAMARQIHFLGSPSIRIDGSDIEKEARGTGSFGFGCRSYATAEGRSGVPSFESIRLALLEADSSGTGK